MSDDKQGKDSNVEPAQRLIPHFHDELAQLKELLLIMAGEAEEQVRQSVLALTSRDQDLTEQVLSGDVAINQRHIEIDERCFKLLALHQPVSTDLRVIVSAVKINSDLERIGDFAVNIAEAAQRYIQHPPVKPLVDIPRMADIAQRMLREALNAYVQHDTTLAQQVLNSDDELDDLKEQVFRHLLGFMCASSTSTVPSLDLILISRHLERIGDHATNIAEEVIFIASGTDVRHHSREGGLAENRGSTTGTT